jgi:hypothetical protein
MTFHFIINIFDAHYYRHYRHYYFITRVCYYYLPLSILTLLSLLPLFHYAIVSRSIIDTAIIISLFIIIIISLYTYYYH